MKTERIPKGGPSAKMPTILGAYYLMCDENDGEPEPVEITLRDGFLMADLPSIGKHGLRSIHEGLSNPRWMKARKATASLKVVPDSVPFGDDGGIICEGKVTVRCGEWFYVKASDPEHSGWMHITDFRRSWGVAEDMRDEEEDQP